MTQRSRGAALVLVLAAVVLLTAVAVELASRAGADSLRATRSARDAQFRRLFDSGSEVGRSLLIESKLEKVVYWGQAWNQELRFVLGAGEEAVLRLEDESGKINIGRAISHPDEATAIRGRLARLFKYLARQDAGSGLDWKQIAEKLDRRLGTRQPLQTLDGLREAGLDAAQVFGPGAACRYLTCFGSGRINLNTAPKAVLYALDPELDDAMVERINKYRGSGEGERGGTYRPFEEPRDLMLVEGIVNRSVGADGEIRVDRNLYEKIQGLVSVGSDCFSAQVRAAAAGRPREAWVFLSPNGSRITFEEILP
jgi:general secretion pathway protein K